MNLQRTHVGIEGSAYDVVIGAGVVESCGRLLAEVTTAKRVSLVTDTAVGEIYGPRVSANLASAGFEVHALSIAPGETSKSWEVAGQLLDAMARDGIERGDLVVALGGGVVGDIAGFAAATYLRGIEFAQIPTTLLAQVDSSIGGKTGVDLRAGKNLAGAFKQPVIVLTDPTTLTTLPEVEWQSGLAEAAKSAVISGEEFLGWMEANAEALVTRRPDECEEMVRRCVAFKAAVVAADAHEDDVRECLNYGHTLGHAIERVAGYGVFSHGAAVAEGMRFAVRLGVDCAHAPREFVARQDALLDRLGLVSITEQFDAVAVAEALRSDKKVRDGVTRWVLAEGPGVWRCQAVDAGTVMEHLQAWAGSKGSD